MSSPTSSSTSSTLAPAITTLPPIVPDDVGMSGGTAFCLFFFIFVLIYFGGGILIRKFLRGAEGPEMIPHYDFWTELPHLIRDGIMFTLNGCKPELSYERI